MSSELRPLSVFAAEDLRSEPSAAQYMRSIAGKIELDDRDFLAAYLRSGQMVLAWMEQTTDVISGQFSVAGGSAILSDGKFFWRLDTADYVEAYGVQLPDEFIRHARTETEQPRDAVQRFFNELDEFFSSGRGSFANLLSPH